MIKGILAADGLQILEMEVDLRRPSSPAIKARAAFVGPNGSTYGWTEGAGALWSPETLKALKQFTDSMERDMAKVHMVGVPTEASGTTGSRGSADEPQGLASHLKGNEAPPL